MYAKIEGTAFLQQNGRRERIIEKELFLLIFLHMPVLTPVSAFAFRLFPFSQIFLICVFIVFSVFSVFYKIKNTKQKTPTESTTQKTFCFCGLFF